MEATFIAALAGLTSIGAYYVGARALGLSSARLGAAVGQMLESVGMILIFLAVNLTTSVLVLLGGATEGGPTEAEVRAAQARLHGIPADAVLTETRAHTTREEAVRVKALLQSRGARTVLLVTNAGHLARARPLFERAGFEVRGVLSDPLVEADAPESRIARMRVLVKEFLGWLYYRVAGYI